MNYPQWRRMVSELEARHDYTIHHKLKLNGSNKVERVCHKDNMMIRKEMTEERPYVLRLRALSEVAYALFDRLLDTSNTVTPYVWATSDKIIWRSWIDGQTGTDWRAEWHSRTLDSLETADKAVFDIISQSPSAQRIALLDMIFLIQDRSGGNWVNAPGDRFYAIDNSILWPVQGRHADKQVINTSQVDHLLHPITDVLIQEPPVEFKGGIFSSAYAGLPPGDWLTTLADFPWSLYFEQLGDALVQLGYPVAMVQDWRFSALEARARWMIDRGRLPTYEEIKAGEWDRFIHSRPGAITVWYRSMEGVEL